ncbi:MAG: branched-chain amino acid transport system ATP-binding protein livF [Acidimicrobiaceae bacterium]|jgi:ABC-type branched-subunit amino acid transport system ATPase component|nr:branched-chain amino acid transport system ATP-binding protein livF [Acidimicrobiaceae bacterium]
MVSEVSVRFGGLQALDAVDLEVAGGEIHGLIGPNGAGKTTLFNVITGLQSPTQGRVHLGTHDVTRAKPHVRSRLGLGRTFQRLELFGTLTARENVQMAAEVQRSKLTSGRTPAQEAVFQLDRVGILHVADEPTDSLPTGLARLVEVARALATSPNTLLLDEPSSGLDATETHGLGEVLAQLAAEGMAILLVEHDMSLVMGVCARVDVLDNGRVIARGDPVSVRANPDVQEAYLGGDAPAAPGDAPVAAVRAGSPTRAPRPRSEEMALSASGLRAAYGRIEVLHGVSLEVPKGSALALLGPNGAGKTTLLKAMSGQLPLTAGTVQVRGSELGRNATERLARSGVCMIPEGRSIFPNLTVTENLLMYTFRRSGLKSARVEERAIERFPVLGGRRKQLAGTLSGGEQRMLSMARALTTDPDILLLDELSMGLAPLIVEELYGFVGQLVASEQLTIVMVEQFVQTALSIADRAAIMVNGELVKEGEPDEIRNEVVGAYLGAEAG